MAVKRPNFSRRNSSVKSVSSKQATKMVAAPTPGKRHKRSSKVTKKSNKGLRLFLYVILIGLLFFDSGWPPGGGLKLSQAQVETYELESYEVKNNEESSMERPSAIEPISFSEERTTILGEVGLSSEQMRKVARNILAIGNAMTDKYGVSDGLTLAMYVLRYLAEIGEYELAHKDIMILVRAFEKLSNTEVGDEVIAILDQVKKIRFGKREGKYFSQFFSKIPSRGIIIPIEQKSDDPDSSLKEIKRVVAVEGSFLYFNEIDTAAEKKQVRDFIKTPVKILNVLEAVVEALNQIFPDLLQGIDDYLERNDTPAPPMMIAMGGISVEVDTRTLFNDITFDFKEGYAFPGIALGGEPLPSFVLGGKAKLLHLKVSIDQ